MSVISSVRLKVEQDQLVSDIGRFWPRAIGLVGQCRSFDGRAKAHRIELAGIGGQTDLDVAQALSPCQLGECHGTELFGAGQRANARVAAMSLHDSREAGPWHEFHELSKQGLANVHVRSPRRSSQGKYAGLDKRSSSRHQTKSARIPHQCLISGSGRSI